MDEKSLGQAAELPGCWRALGLGGWARLPWNNSSNWAGLAIRANHICSSSLIIHSWTEGSVEVLDKGVFRAVPLLTTAWEWLFMCECQRIWHDRLESKNSALKEMAWNVKEWIGFQWSNCALTLLFHRHQPSTFVSFERAEGKKMRLRNRLKSELINKGRSRNVHVLLPKPFYVCWKILPPPNPASTHLETLMLIQAQFSYQEMSFKENQPFLSGLGLFSSQHLLWHFHFLQLFSFWI